jgi:hypothetical protein
MLFCWQLNKEHKTTMESASQNDGSTVASPLTPVGVKSVRIGAVSSMTGGRLLGATAALLVAGELCLVFLYRPNSNNSNNMLHFYLTRAL